jgi:hypothetical protein
MAAMFHITVFWVTAYSPERVGNISAQPAENPAQDGQVVLVAVLFRIWEFAGSNLVTDIGYSDVFRLFPQPSTKLYENLPRLFPF